MELQQSLKAMEKLRLETLKKQTECNKEITKIKGMDGEVVKTGIFGKANKADKIKELEEHLNTVAYT